MAPGPTQGKPTYCSPGPRARRLLSYIGVLARGWAAYVGHVAPQCGALSAIWFPQGHHGGSKLMRFGVLGLLCWPYGYEACIWETQNNDFEESCIVLTHFRVPKWRWSKGGEPQLLNTRGLAREGYLIDGSIDGSVDPFSH